MPTLQFSTVAYVSVADPHHLNANPDPASHFDADPDPSPDPTFHSDANPDPSFQYDCRSGSGSYPSLFARFGPSNAPI